MRAAFVSLALLCGCAKDFDRLAPFPCPRSGTCPASLYCYNGQCESAAMVEHATCSSTLACPSPYLCFNGQCQTAAEVEHSPCSPTVACPSPYVCGVALGGTGPQHPDQCETLDHLAHFTCPADFACPSPFICADDECVRPPGGPQGECNPCAAGSGNCCQPVGFPYLTGDRGRCTVMNTTVSNTTSTKDAVRPFCVQLHGTGATGASCQIVYEEPPGFTGVHFPNADRDCGNGFICWNPGLDPQKPATCRSYCTANPAFGFPSCASGTRCFAFAPTGWSICVPTCTLLGSDCPAGQVCALASDAANPAPGSYFGYCSPPGTIGEGQQCQIGNLWFEQCAAGLTCWKVVDFQPNVCSKICRSGSECPSGQKCCGPQQCSVSPGVSSSVGVCGT